MNTNIRQPLSVESPVAGGVNGVSQSLSKDAPKQFQQLLDVAKQSLALKQSLASGAASVTAQAQAISTTSIPEKEKKKLSISLNHVDQYYLAQLSEKKSGSGSSSRIPLQVFLDQALQSLQSISDEEHRMNNLIQRFVKNDENDPVSEDEVVLAVTKLNLSISMVTTVVQSAVQTFKEVQNIPV